MVDSVYAHSPSLSPNKSSTPSSSRDLQLDVGASVAESPRSSGRSAADSDSWYGHTEPAGTGGGDDSDSQKRSVLSEAVIRKLKVKNQSLEKEVREKTAIPYTLATPQTLSPKPSPLNHHPYPGTLNAGAGKEEAGGGDDEECRLVEEEYQRPARKEDRAGREHSQEKSHPAVTRQKKATRTASHKTRKKSPDRVCACLSRSLLQ